ncbi:hypothetical protein AAGF08_09695 [Algoriphagus sp. SE2]|uniref:hypothetical protein n=1 Tax=Algoriphagus sp. SE2 TaxID=3141536 RepID=UPI0031CD28F7
MSRIEQLNRNPFLSLHDLSIFYDFKFDPIKEYISYSNNHILKVEEKVRRKIIKWDHENSSDPEIPDGYDVYQNEINTIREFRPILYNSMFLTIYSLFENEFIALCEYAAKIQDSSLHPKDLSGKNYIDQCRRYIVKVLEVNLDKLNTEWEDITKFQTLRNSFAHKNGILKDKSAKYVAFINRTKGLSLDEKTFKIKIKNYEFLISVINKLVRFLNSAIDKIVEQKG